jgi:hypothetical protein
MCVLGVYVYTLDINSEMSVNVSAFVGKLNIALLKKHFYFPKIGPQKQKSHHLYWNPDEISKKKYLSICANMKLFFFYLETILLTCRWRNENKPAQICMYGSHDNL